MDKKLIIAYALSLVALIMMKMHLPGNAILLFGSVIFQVVIITINALFSNERRPMTAYYFSCTLLILCLFERFMFFPHMFFFEMAIISACIHFYIDYKNKSIKKLRNTLLLLFLFCGLTLSLTKTSTIYQYKYADALISADNVCYDKNEGLAAYHCCHWAQYAYYFAIEGNTTDALKAIDTSIDIAQRAQCKPHALDALRQQRHLIETNHNTIDELLPTLIEEWDF